MAPNPTLILFAAPRLSRAKPIRDLRAIDQYSALFLGFDFGPALAAGVTLSAPSIGCAVYQYSAATDASASTRKLGASALAPSIKTGQPNQMVVQLIGLMLPTVKYTLQCLATSSEGETVELWGVIPCRPLPIAPATLQPLVDAQGNVLVDAQGNPLLG